MDRSVLLFIATYFAPALPALTFSYSTGLFNTKDYPSISTISNLNKFLQINPLNPFQQPETQTRVCLTAGCVKASADLIRSMDETVDPCEDFYNFACGKFIDETVIPDHKNNMGKFSLLRDKLNLRLKQMLEDAPEPSEPKIYSSVRNLYASCMDGREIEANSVNDLKKVIKQLGGWPVLEGESWSGNSFKWWELAVAQRNEGFDFNQIFDMNIRTNQKNSEERMLDIDQPRLGLEREYLIKGFNDKDVQAYYNYMVQTAIFLGARETDARVEMKRALELELKLAEMSIPREKRRNKTALYNPMSLSEVQQMYPELPVLYLVNNLLGSAKITIEKSEIVNVKVPQFILDFRNHIAKVDSRTQANYMIWRNIKSSMIYLNSKALEIELQYDKVITGKARKSPRWEKCAKSTAGLRKPNLYFIEGSLTNAVGGMYAKKFFDLEAKDMVDELVENVKDIFKQILDEVEWMDSTTRAKAHIKIDKMTPHMAYAKEILNKRLIDEYYEGLVLDDKSYLMNMLRLKKFITNYIIKEFRNPIDKKSWKTHGGAAIVNAFYNPEENSMVFPAGILDGVFFQKDRPLYMNYGGIGFVIGHEITHGFDDEGSQTDGEGNLVNWWQPETKQKYLEKAQCIIDQYGNYTVKVEGETLNVNGINTQGENIADNGGVKEAFRAYDSIVRKFGPEPILPGLKYTQRQLMWLSGANIWCSVRRPASLKQQVLTDPHSPARFRVNGPFSNTKEFSKDWGCPLGSPMNPVKKCSVW